MATRNQGQHGMIVVNGNPVINNLDAANQYAVNLNSYEFLTQSLYDSAAYPTTGIAQLTFFQFQVGAGVSVISGGAKTLEDTNMLAAGSMPAMQAFVVTGIELDMQPAVPAFTAATLPAVFGAQAVASPINDVWKVRATGWLQFNIGSKAYMTEGPLMRFPASTDLEIDAAAADVSTAGASFQTRISYAKAVGVPYLLAPNNLLLIPNQNFSLTLNWATLQTVVTAMRIFARFTGQLIRAAQ
jgi:hypothetical protein